MLLTLGALSGCGAMVQSNSFMTIDKNTAVTPDSGKALVIFERENNHTGSFHNMAVWDITKRDKIKFIGLLAPTMKAAASVPPGEHKFMTTLTGGRIIMQANVEAGKTYYVMPSFGMGGFKYILYKQGLDNPMDNKNIGKPNAKAMDWSARESTQNSIQSHLSAGLSLWNSMTPSQKEALTLESYDGR